MHVRHSTQYVYGIFTYTCTSEHAHTPTLYTCDVCTRNQARFRSSSKCSDSPCESPGLYLCHTCPTLPTYQRTPFRHINICRSMKYSMRGQVITQKTSRTMKIAREHTHTHTRSHSTDDGHQPAWTKSENGPLLVSSLQPGLTTTNSKLPISCCSANDFDLNRVSLCSLSYFSFFTRLMCSLLRQVYYVSG